MKICVYAICKNESKFVNRWFNSMKEADEIYALDTGSTDNTVDLLSKLGVHVKTEIINPWRFDVARNKSLDMLPSDTDLCVCTDLDEIFERGWRAKLEEKATGYNHIKYNYIWSFDKYGNPAVNFYQEKIHGRNGFKWINPVHEVLETNINEKYVTIPEITLKHYPDNSKSRSSYLPLLELAVKENPNNDRNMHYLGREYMFYQNYEKAIETLKKHLNMPTATWNDERCASYRFICRCYKNLHDYNNAIIYGLKGISESPYIREPYFELAYVYYELQDFNKCKLYLLLALEIRENNKSYINEPNCYNGMIEDLLSVCYFYLNDLDKSLMYVNLALDLDPESERIINNKKIIINEINKTIKN
jgi:tetratricopeptide (TPR) repeat protein